MKKRIFALIAMFAVCCAALCACGKSHPAKKVYLDNSYGDRIEFDVDASGYVYAPNADCVYSSDKDVAGIIAELENNDCKSIVYGDETYLVKRDAEALLGLRIVEVDDKSKTEGKNSVYITDKQFVVIDRDKDDTENGVYIGWQFPFPYFMLDGVIEQDSRMAVFCGNEYKVKDVEKLMDYIEQFEIFDVQSEENDGVATVRLSLKSGKKSIAFSLKDGTAVFSREK